MSMPDGTNEIDAICRLIAHGRLLARKLSQQLRATEFSEAEFRLLWMLRVGDGPEQKKIAAELGVSTAQVSAIVERLCASGVIESHSISGDRRRQHWKLTLSGKKRIAEIAKQLISHWQLDSDVSLFASLQQREAA